MTGISWTNMTWNPIVGCSIVSPGCTNCYAMKMAGRLAAMGTPHYHGLTTKTKAGSVWTGKADMAPQSTLTKPLRWKKPRKIFVNSMGDLFHEDVPDEWIDRVFAVMALAPQHTFQVLTKRADRMRQYISRPNWHRGPLGGVRRVGSHGMAFEQSLAAIKEGFNISLNAEINASQWPLPNVWLGVSAEDQTRADERIPDLLATPAAVRFVSYEPALGPVDFKAIAPDGLGQSRNALDGTWLVRFRTTDGKREGMVRVEANGSKLDWIIAGGESGPRARPAHPQWFRSVRDQCNAAGVAFHFKQWGEYAPLSAAMNYPAGWDGLSMQKVGTNRAGRLLDGVEHGEFPK
jgi:protein gp37